jgi:ribosomal protein S3
MPMSKFYYLRKLFFLESNCFNNYAYIREYVDTAVRHVMMRQGILGVKVAVMLPHDPKGVIGPKTLLSDVITILEPKEDLHSY